ncbi:unnamed protein product [Schistosoma turkestanicum]|nr:unnamed protein product [Schistosoma turkestanicum]
MNTVYNAPIIWNFCKLYILLKVVVFCNNLTNYTMNETLSSQYEFLSLWKLKSNHSINLEYGFPVNLIGNLIPTVELQFHPCNQQDAADETWTDCQTVYVTSSCHFTYEQINHLENIAFKSNNCSQYAQSKLSSNRWISEMYKKSTQVVSIQAHRIMTNMEIREFFKECGNYSQYFNNKSLISLCDWDYYTELITDSSSLDVYGHLNTSSILSGKA